MKELNITLTDIHRSKMKALHPINVRIQNHRRRLSFKERFGFGIMYQHPRIYDFALWMNDPQQLIP
ncbi:MAG: hypothetical protein ACTSSH_04410, partial [Candidatus Heimdallarchaeota archaeon]